MSDLGHAISRAALAHQGQTDWRGESYILHPLRVMQAVRSAGFPVVTQIAAVLHDVIEDTHVNYTQLRTVFGEDVEGAVEALTRRFDEHPDAGAIGYDDHGAKMWGKPQETHWEYFERCVQNPIARVVKYYDTLDNMDPNRFHPKAPYKRYLRVLDWYREEREQRLGRAEHGVIS